MRNKKLVEEDPAWKIRRRDLERQIRKGRLIKVLAYIGVTAAVVLYIGFQLRGFWAPPPKDAPKPKPHHGIARVVDKRVETNSGKTKRVVIFSVSRWTVEKAVDEKQFDSIEKGEKVLLSYDVDTRTGRVHVRGWETDVKGL